MITCNRYARLGNQLFQIAAVIGHSVKHGTKYFIPGSTINERIWPSYTFRNVIHKNIKHSFPIYKEPCFEYREIPNWPDICLDGFFQSEKYFSHCREEIIKAFGFRYLRPLEAVSIHIRRGDYLLYSDKHPVINENYLDEAIRLMCDVTGMSRFIVFSDDIPFCKKLITSRLYYGCHFEFSEGNTAIEDLELMSNCAHNIIANSTFSWWAAWLNQNPKKTIISPSKEDWFGPGNKHLNTKDLIPDSWIQIKSKVYETN